MAFGVHENQQEVIAEIKDLIVAIYPFPVQSAENPADDLALSNSCLYPSLI